MTPEQDATFFFRLTRYKLSYRWLSLMESKATRQTAIMYACIYGYCFADQRGITLERNSSDYIEERHQTSALPGASQVVPKMLLL